MKRSVQILLLTGTILLIVAAYTHVYEASSHGLLPVINYPLRPYTVPLLAFAVLCLLAALVLHTSPREPP